jgi:hypothetical protein
MGVDFFEQDKKVVFHGIIYENEVVSLRDFLKKQAPNKIIFDFSRCEDLHTAILQMIISYELINSVEYIFNSDEVKSYQKFLEGLELTENNENNCN